VSQSGEFCAITLCVASQRVFIVVSVYFNIDSVRKLLDTPAYVSFFILSRVGRSLDMGWMLQLYKHQYNFRINYGSRIVTGRSMLYHSFSPVTSSDLSLILVSVIETRTDG
jgi:hypothetical protein